MSSDLKSFFEKQFGNKVHTLNAVPGAAAGDNFTSTLYGIKVQFESDGKQNEYFLKTFPENELRIDFLKSCNIFYKEFKFYSEYVSNVSQILKETAQLKLKFPTFIKGFAYDYSKEVDKEICPISNNFICMEDMRSMGFSMDRFREMKLEHCKLVFDSFALNHAASVAYKERNNLKSLTKSFPYFKDALLLPNVGIIQLVRGHLEKMKEAVAMKCGIESKVFKALEKLSLRDILTEIPKFVEEINEDEIDQFPRIPNPYSRNLIKDPWLVQCCGDVWKGNLLFKYNEVDEPIEIVQVDFQFIHESCPTYDFVYFLYCSTSVQFRNKYTNKLLKFYEEKFLFYCKALGVFLLPGFNYESLKARYHRMKYFGFLIAIFAIPFQVNNLEKDFDEKLAGVTNKDQLWENAVSINMNEALIQMFVDEANQAYADGII